MTLAEQTKMNEELLKQKSRQILSNLAGYVSTRVMEIGKEMNIFDELSQAQNGLNTTQLAKKLEYDEGYLQIWLDSAYSFDLVKKINGKYELSEFVEPLLLDRNFGGFIGGFPELFTKKELFDNFKKRLLTGERIWWDQVSEEWIDQVAKSTYPMYIRMLNRGFTKIPDLVEKLEKGANFLEMASGAGVGLSKIIEIFPESEYTGLDGDKYSLQIAEKYMEKENLTSKVNFIHRSFEDMDMKNEYDVVFINASMHECRDLDKTTSNVYDALKTGGVFIISDLPFPESDKEYRELPNQIMIGINFFESQIDDELLPTKEYVDLLQKHQFENVDSFELTPTHSVIYGYKN